jgi:hypothetical protein
MILLDTNVVSEFLKLTGDISILTWNLMNISKKGEPSPQQATPCLTR